MVRAPDTTSRKRLVTFLGTGDYQEARHKFPDGSEGASTRYVCRALAEHLRADEIDVLATKEAEEKHRAGLTDALRKANLPAANFHRVPFGATPAELWEQFEVIKDRLRAPAGIAVALDITFSFRSQPFFAAAVSAFVRAVDRDPAPINIYYGAFNQQGKATRIWDLSPFIELLDWTQAIMLFLRTGRSAGIAERTTALGDALGRRWAENKQGTPPNLKKLGEALRQFGGNLETLRTGDLLLGDRGSAEAMLAAIQATRASAAAMPPLADVLDRLEHEMLSPLLGACDHLANDDGHKALAGLARLYLEMGRWAEAAAVLREGWITRYATPAAAFVGRNQSRPSIDERARRDAEDRWNEEERDAARQIGAVRNDIEHAGFKYQPAAAGGLQNSLGKLIEDFAALPSAVERARAAGNTPVFVNLSNHPSGDWSATMRRAALDLAPEIKDLEFPSVPPEAGAAEIGARPDQLVETLIKNFPGANHAMVQGEFTLAHMLVRNLQARGIVCLAATTHREVVEQSEGTRTTRFNFVRFREYG